MKYSSRGKNRFIALAMVAAGLLCAGPAAAAGGWIPNDPGAGHTAGGWQSLQWNLTGAHSVQAPQAWANLIADGRPGAKGVVVAVLDSGVAYTNWGGYKRSPDLASTRFIDPCDLVAGTLRNGRCTDTHPVDANGHGTWVTSAIAESTNNKVGVTGLAYGATIMPIRVLDAKAQGSPETIAEGIDYAVDHGAQVINLSFEFLPETPVVQVEPMLAAIHYAHAHGVVVVAAAGNDRTDQLSYPARDPDVISVGATTADGCLADYSNASTALDLVAPGGGDDAALNEPQCHPARTLPSVYQETYLASRAPNVFGLPAGWTGTSMAAPAVSAAAAMVIASGVVGNHPTPAQVLARLESTATRIGGVRHSADYGYGLLNVAAATTGR